MKCIRCVLVRIWCEYWPTDVCMFVYKFVFYFLLMLSVECFSRLLRFHYYFYSIDDVDCLHSVHDDKFAMQSIVKWKTIAWSVCVSIVKLIYLHVVHCASKHSRPSRIRMNSMFGDKLNLALTGAARERDYWFRCHSFCRFVSQPQSIRF